MLHTALSDAKVTGTARLVKANGVVVEIDLETDDVTVHLPRPDPRFCPAHPDFAQE